MKKNGAAGNISCVTGITRVITSRTSVCQIDLRGKKPRVPQGKHLTETKRHSRDSFPSLLGDTELVLSDHRDVLLPETVEGEYDIVSFVQSPQLRC